MHLKRMQSKVLELKVSSEMQARRQSLVSSFFFFFLRSHISPNIRNHQSTLSVAFHFRNSAPFNS